MGQNQKNRAHHESVEVSLLEQHVEVLGERDLAAGFPSQVIPYDPFVAKADSLKLEYPSR